MGCIGPDRHEKVQEMEQVETEMVKTSKVGGDKIHQRRPQFVYLPTRE